MPKCGLRTESGSRLNIVRAVSFMKSSQACFLALDRVCSTGHTEDEPVTGPADDCLHVSGCWVTYCQGIRAGRLEWAGATAQTWGGAVSVLDWSCCSSHLHSYACILLEMWYQMLFPGNGPNTPLSLRCEFWQLQFTGALVMLSFLNA